MTTASAGSSATVSAASSHQAASTIQERKPPTRLSAGSRADAVSMKRPAFRIASRSASPKSAPGATRWSGQVEQQHERRDQHGAPAPRRRERALEAASQHGHAEVGEPEDQVEEECRAQSLGREVARRPGRLRHEDEEDGDVIERAALARDRRSGSQPQQHEGRAEERERTKGGRLERDERGNGHEQERRHERGASERSVGLAPERRRERLGEQVDEEEDGDDGEDTRPGRARVRLGEPGDEAHERSEPAGEVEQELAARESDREKPRVDQEQQPEQDAEAGAVARHGREVKGEEQRQRGSEERRVLQLPVRRRARFAAARECQDAERRRGEDEEDRRRRASSAPRRGT